jgi:hypothetical protein
MLLRSYIAIIFVALLFSCGPSHLYDKQTSVLDSTKIVLQVKINELKKIETNIEQRGFSKFEIYKKFLKSNVNDTISRVEASALQQFLNAGEVIQIYNQGKSDIIQQTEISVAQLQKLSSDLKENNLPQNQALNYFDAEKDHAGKLVSVIERNINAVNISLVNFKTALPRTEEYIKKINNGQLPTVVADATSE